MLSQLAKTPEFWVAVSFLGFVALLLRYKVPSLIGKVLDQRADTIRAELDEARRLRTEAQAILDDYKTKHSRAQQEADAIVAVARAEADAIAVEARRSLQESVERRTKLAEDKIARAEQQALGEVRAAAVDAAIAAAEKLIGARVSGASAGNLIDKSIAELGRKLN
jgi:F-type H+-transporting ATPase subunit b